MNSQPRKADTQSYSAKKWWDENVPTVKPPTVRWFGPFRRSLRLDSHRSGVVQIPEANPGESVTVDCASHESGCRVVTAVPVDGPPDRIYTSLLANTAAAVGIKDVAVPDVAPDGTPVTTSAPLPLAIPHGAIIAPPPGLSLSQRLAYVLQVPLAKLFSPAGPLEWPATLFPYQIEGVQILISRDSVLLADDMGLGKTVQTLAALRILMLGHRTATALLVVPLVVLSQWRLELRRWAPELRVSTVHGAAEERAWQWRVPAHVFLTTYEVVRSDLTGNPSSPIRRVSWDVVILDEAQRIKNRDTELSRRCKRVPRKRAWALTGTPLENRLDDLASILEFVGPHADGAPLQPVRTDARMHERHREVQLRRRKADVLPQLPPKLVKEVVIPLSDGQMETYRRAEREGVIALKRLGEQVRVSNVLELILRLKQICNFCPTTGESAKLADVRERVEALVAEGHRALVFSQFTDEDFGVGAISSGLSTFRPLAYTGSMAGPERQRAVERFKADDSHKLLVLSLRAGGQGLNLQQASYVFHFDRWWNPAVEHQAEDRSHRMGQEWPVHVYKYVCEGTVEERIDEVIKQKQTLFDETVDDVSLDLGRGLTAEELFGLFGLKPPTVVQSVGRVESVPTFGSMTGIEFEEYLRTLLVKRGWFVETTPVTRDGGIDLKAVRNADVEGPTTLLIQCKNYVQPVGVDVIRAMAGVLPPSAPAVRGVVACPGGFTGEARAFAQQRGILLWNRSELFRLATIERPAVDAQT